MSDHCKNCGIPRDQFDEEALEEADGQGNTLREFNEERMARGYSPFCSFGCLDEKLGVVSR